MIISTGLFRQCLLAGMASLVFGSVAQANILPVDAVQPASKNMPIDTTHRFAGLRPTGESASPLLTSVTSSDDAGKRFEITYQLLAQLGSLENTALAYGSTDESATTPGFSLFQRIVLDDSEQRVFPDMAILAALLLLVGGIGYAQHLAKKQREQPRRRPLYTV